MKRWVAQRRLAEARELAELRDAAPEPAQALERGLALIAFVRELNASAVRSLEPSTEDLEAYRRWAAVRTALRG